MKQKIEGAIKKRKVIMAIMEIILIIACSVFIWIMTIPKDKFLASTYSYSKVEKYEINGDYLTRVMPQTDYETFIKIAQNTIKDTVSQDFSIKIYKNKEKTQEVTSGYMATGMVAVVNYKDMVTNENVAESKNKSEENVVDENNENSMNTENATDSNSTNIANENEEENLSDENDKKTGDNQEVSKDLEYTISVIGDLTGNGDMNVTELTRIVRGVVKLKNWDFKDEEKLIVDLNGDGQIDVTDVECCINYIVFGEFEVVKKDVVYTVEYYKEELDGSYVLSETENLKGAIGEKVTAKAKEYTGFTEDASNKDRITEGTIAEDGSLALRLYYTRNQYTLTLNKDENIEDVTGAGTYKYGATVSINATLKEEIGYDIKWNKWVSANTEIISDKEEQNATIEMPAGEVTLTATTTKETKADVEYKVEHYKEELDGSYILAETENLKGTTGEKVTAKAKEYAGFTEDASNKDRIAEGTIAGDGSLTLRLYYTRNRYKITFKDYDGRIISDKEYKYEQTVEIPENPTRESDETYTYEFIGWSPEVTQTATQSEEYIAMYKETYIEYTVTFKNYDGTIISSKTNYHYGDIIEFPQNPMRDADDNYEYKFAGWDKEEKKVTKDEIYTATYNAINYKISIEKQNGIILKYISFEEAFKEVQEEQINIKIIDNVIETITIPENMNVTIDLNNYKISSNEETTIINNGNIVIVDNSIEKGGMIENVSNNAIINNGNLTLGYDDGVVEENILIKGKENAIQNNNNFYMYDGTLIGKTTITGNNAIIPKGEEYGISIREEEGIQIATIKVIEIPQALVGETYYMTLQEAIDNNDNETIYVVKKNIEVIGGITIDATKNLTIDLNGNNITGSNNTGYVIDNAGTLLIKDTNESNMGTITNTAGSTIHNNGSLTMQSININSYSYGVYNQKDLEMKDVNVESSNSAGVYNMDPLNDINFTMIRGNITGKNGIGNSKDQASNSMGNISVQITNATINGGLYSSTRYNTDNSKIVVEINHTTIKSESQGIDVYGANNELTLKDSKLDVENCYTGIRLSGGPNRVLLENTQVNMTSDDYNQHCEIYCSGDYNLIIDKNTQITSTNTKGEIYAIYSDDINSFGRIKLIDGTISAVAKGGYGVYLNSGYFDFLGGSVNATTQTIDANIGSIAEGKQVQTVYDEDKYISTLIDSPHTEYVASIGEEKYYLLKEAIAACESTVDATTITMLSDYEQWESLTVSNEKNITLDLNGHKIVAHSEFVNEGRFEVTDKSESQTGTIEEKTNRAVFNKENATFTLSGGRIVLNSTTLSKCAIYNTDQANINITKGTVEINNSRVYLENYIIYNKSKGKIELTGGNLKGNTTAGSLYGIYNYVDDAGGDRNVIISNLSIEISYSNIGKGYGIYSYTTHSSNITDTSRDTIDLSISNSNINVEGNNYSVSYGICNYASYGRDTIKMNLQSSTLNVTNNSYYSDGALGIKNTVENSSSSFIYNNIENGSIKAIGKYKGDRYGILNSGRNITINLGTQGIESDIGEPIILGDTCGINSSNSNTINFFRGIIKGASAISDTTILSLEEGKEINQYVDEVDGYDTIMIQSKTPEAQIGAIQYTTLQEAVNACNDDATEFTTIELIKEVNNMTTSVTVGEKKKIMLDLKGYNFTSLAEHTIINNGSLNIIDSEGTGTIKNNSEIAIGNYGDLTVNAVNVYGKTVGIANYENSSVKINQANIDSSLRGIYNYSQAKVLINSSRVVMSNGKYGINNVYGDVDIINSEISVKNGESTYGIYSNGNINIENTNIIANCTSSQPEIYRAYGIYIAGGKVTIGEKNNTSLDNTMITSSNIGVYKNSGNTTSFNYYGGDIIATERVVQGSVDDTPTNKTIFIDTETNRMTLVDKQKENVAKIGESQYSSLSEAIKEVPEGEEQTTLIKIIANYDITSTDEVINVTDKQKITLDLNGHVVTAYTQNIINNSGELKIIDSSEAKDGKLISKFNTGVRNNGEVTLNEGTIQAVRNGIYNTEKSKITIKGGMIEVLAEDRASSAGIYVKENGNVKLLGGTIRAVKNKWNRWNTYDGSSYVAGILLDYAYIEINGGNILVENNTNYFTYGIVTDHSIIDLKSGNMVINANDSGFSYGISGMYGYKDDGNDIRISGGNIKILKDSLNHADGIYLESYSSISKLTMTGGTVEAISNNSGIVKGIETRDKTTIINVLGGKIYASSNGQSTAISGSDITIGTKDGNMIKSEPVIEGKTYGIEGENIKFYDGTIRGATAVTKTPTDVEAGYKISIASSGEVQSATLTLISTAEAIAQIGNLYFNDLQQAINACLQADTINILTAIKCNQTLTIEEGKNVTIDLMGNTLNADRIDNIIINYGTLTIVDSVGGGSVNGKIDNQGQLNQ